MRIVESDPANISVWKGGFALPWYVGSKITDKNFHLSGCYRFLLRKRAWRAKIAMRLGRHDDAFFYQVLLFFNLQR